MLLFLVHVTWSTNFPFSSISYTWLGSVLTKLDVRTTLRLESGLPSSEQRNWYLFFIKHMYKIQFVTNIRAKKLFFHSTCPLDE